MQRFVGLPLTDLWKPIFFVFEFGEQKPFINSKGKEAMRSDLCLRVFAEWRIVQGTVVVLGSDDYRVKRRFFKRRTPPPKERRARWEAAKALFDAMDDDTLVCIGVKALPTGFIQILFEGGYALEIVSCSSDRSGEWEIDDLSTDYHFSFWGRGMAKKESHR